jgi:hypothetical protein
VLALVALYDKASLSELTVQTMNLCVLCQQPADDGRDTSMLFGVMSVNRERVKELLMSIRKLRCAIERYIAGR